MKINIKAEINSEEILRYFAEQLKNSGVDTVGGNFTIQAFSEKKAEWIEVKDAKVLFEKV